MNVSNDAEANNIPIEGSDEADFLGFGEHFIELSNSYINLCHLFILKTFPSFEEFILPRIDEICFEFTNVIKLVPKTPENENLILQLKGDSNILAVELLDIVKREGESIALLGEELRDMLFRRAEPPSDVLIHRFFDTASVRLSRIFPNNFKTREAISHISKYIYLFIMPLTEIWYEKNPLLDAPTQRLSLTGFVASYLKVYVDGLRMLSDKFAKKSRLEMRFQNPFGMGSDIILGFKKGRYFNQREDTLMSKLEKLRERKKTFRSHIALEESERQVRVFKRTPSGLLYHIDSTKIPMKPGKDGFYISPILFKKELRKLITTTLKYCYPIKPIGAFDEFRASFLSLPSDVWKHIASFLPKDGMFKWLACLCRASYLFRLSMVNSTQRSLTMIKIIHPLTPRSLRQCVISMIITASLKYQCCMDNNDPILSNFRVSELESDASAIILFLRSNNCDDHYLIGVLNDLSQNQKIPPYLRNWRGRIKPETFAQFQMVLTKLI